MASFFTANPGAAPVGPFTSSTASDIMLGAKFVDQVGNSYRRALVGASALVPGTLLQAAAEITAHQDLTPAAAAVGATQITVTLGAAAATANQYAGGYVVIAVTPGQGYRYLISSHPAANASATLVLTLEDPITVALTTSSRVDLVPNPYSGVIINPSAASSAPIGAAIYAAAAGTYTWIQTGGDAVVLADGAVVVGTSVVASNSVAGAVEALVGVQAPVGIARTGIATTQYGIIKLTLDD